MYNQLCGTGSAGFDLAHLPQIAVEEVMLCIPEGNDDGKGRVFDKRFETTADLTFGIRCSCFGFSVHVHLLGTAVDVRKQKRLVYLP